MSWLRWWEGTVTDPKWRVVSARSNQPVGNVLAVWAFVLEEARRGDGALPELDCEVIGACLGYNPDEVRAILEAMKAKGSIDETGVKNWRKRQPKREDDSRKRVNEWRDRKRDAAGNADVTRSNAPEAEAEAEKKHSTLLRSVELKVRKNGTRISENWSADRVFAKELGFSEAEITTEEQKFKDYWVAAPKGVKLDWGATWRNWIRSAMERRGQNRGPPAAAQSGFAAVHERLRSQNDDQISRTNRNDADRNAELHFEGNGHPRIL